MEFSKVKWIKNTALIYAYDGKGHWITDLHGNRTYTVFGLVVTTRDNAKCWLFNLWAIQIGIGRILKGE